MSPSPVRSPQCSPAARLARYGRLLWGEQWQSAMARELGVNIRTVQRWAAGVNEPPEGVWLELRMRARDRITALREVVG
jgi:hypothetical protein